MPRRKWLYAIGAIILGLPFLNLMLGIHPPKFTTASDPTRYGLDFEKVAFPTSDGLTLRGWFIPAASASPGWEEDESAAGTPCGTILVGHGYPFDKANILGHAIFLHSRFNLLLFDFRYFGESDGWYTTAGLLEVRDVHAAVNYIKGRPGVDPDRIGVMGFSMSASAFLLARNPDVKAIVADSPYSSLEAVIARQFFMFPGPVKWPFVALTKLYARLMLGVRVGEAAPVEAVREITSPVFLIHGSADSQIPVSHSQAIAANARPGTAELWIVPGADHGYARAREGYRYEIRVRKFFERHLCPGDS
jgi:uncharacterized protein